jgi:hypothetical protein
MSFLEVSFLEIQSLAAPLSFNPEGSTLAAIQNRDIQNRAVTGLNLVGDGGQNSLKGGKNDDVLRGKGGNDRLDGGRGADQLFGDRGNDTLLGGSGKDILSGGKGKDTLVGGGGSDSLMGGGGADQLTGGNGSDQFALNLNHASLNTSQVVTITDFTKGKDTLQLSQITFDQLTVTQVGGDTLLQVKAGQPNAGLVLARFQGVQLTLAELSGAPVNNPGTPGTPPPTGPIEADAAKRAAKQLTVGATTLYIGYNQVSSDNKDPWLASYTNGTLNWYRTDYEITGDDGTGTNLVWDGGSNLYAAFTSTGTQGTADQDFRRFAATGWLKSYSDASPGGGGGGKVAILAKVDPLTGNITNASFLTALNGSKTNSVSVKTLALNGNNLVVQADSAFAPRKPDKTAMSRNGNPQSSPNYTVEFAPDLGMVISAVSTDYS